MKKAFWGVVWAVVIAMSGVMVYAQDLNKDQQMMNMPMGEHKKVDTGTSDKAVNVGNTICPATGEKIDEKTKATYEYERKIYNFCCSACIDEFKKDPNKYIKKVEEELQAKVKEEVSQ